MKNLRVLLLGTPEVYWNGEPFQIQRRYPRALLYYLTAQGRRIGREQLLTMFWGEEPETTARLRLRETLNKLRSALPDPQILIADNTLVGLDFQRVSSDLLEFQATLHRFGHEPWKTPANEPLPESVYQALRQAMLLWRSPHFMAGANLPSTHELDEWLAHLSQHTEHLRVSILERLSEHELVCGDLEQSLHLARLALENDELNEDLHERVMRLLIWMDRRDEARQHYLRFQNRLQREFKLNPAPRLVSLYQLIQTGAKPIPIRSNIAWHLRPSLMAPFVGRQQPLTQLRLAFHKGGGVFLFGEAGLGKTRLLQEFTTHLEPSPRLLLTRCLPNETNLPLQPIIELARRDVLPDEWRNIPAAWARQILPVLPDLGLLRTDLERNVSNEAEPSPGLLREAIRQMAANMAHRQRLLGILDEAQWADEETLDTIAYLLVRPPFDSQSTLIIASRGEVPNPHLKKVLTSLQQTGHATVIQLLPLTLSEVMELCRNVLPDLPSSQFVEQLAANTGGNPFYILETLRVFIERDHQPGAIESVTLPLADSISNALQSRLQPLTPVARDLLDSAAIIGTVFSPHLAGKAAQISPEEIVGAVAELESHHLVESVGDKASQGSYHFIHGLLRDLLLQHISPVKADWLNQQFAQVLIKRSRKRDQ